MRARRVTMGKVAAETGINYITLSKLNNLHQNPTPKQAFLLAEFFGVKPDDIFGMADE